ncbi:hypothetical protein [Lentisalinibacter sediminis]|uniref:hypothetical protein n=1 Tax=Lentisalinibacter sediminis TaxID=2992237 RepID=UPI003866A3DB
MDEVAGAAGPFSRILSEHKSLRSRRRTADDRLIEIRSRFESSAAPFNRSHCTVFCAGSLGRGDVGEKSDLDVFLLSDESHHALSRLDELEMLAHVIGVNRELGSGPLSNDGEFLKVHSIQQMLQSLGAPKDDSENLFTVRMLLILESRCVCNDEIYESAIDSVIDHYFRDSRGKRSFRPLFLLNDLLRFWRTLCLNYELIRDDPEKPWRKKNINLKFSRMMTVFGTVLPMMAEPVKTAAQVKSLVRLSPLQRLAFGLDELQDESLQPEFEAFLDDYERFLVWKEKLGTQELPDEELSMSSRKAARRVSNFLYRALSHPGIDQEQQKYLIL